MPVTWRAGTFAAACTAAALAVACSTAPPRSPEQARIDASAADEVYAALNTDPVYFYRHVDVQVANGVADLSGYVWSTEALYRARQIAHQVPGINRVVTSRLELERNGATGGRTR
jgi:osmotically-inducible protein OsmY